MALTPTRTRFSSYEEARASHKWEVPDRYNIAADVCDKHPHDKLAMVWEDHRGAQRNVTWGELQSLAAQAANVLRSRGYDCSGAVGVNVASFQYRVSDNGNPGPGVNGAYVTVSFSPAGPAIYFTKNVAVAPGNCTLGAALFSCDTAAF